MATHFEDEELRQNINEVYSALCTSKSAELTQCLPDTIRQIPVSKFSEADRDTGEEYPRNHSQCRLKVYEPTEETYEVEEMDLTPISQTSSQDDADRNDVWRKPTHMQEPTPPESAMETMTGLPTPSNNLKINIQGIGMKAHTVIQIGDPFTSESDMEVAGIKGARTDVVKNENHCKDPACKRMVDEDLKMESKQAEPHNIIEFPPESSHGGAHGENDKNKEEVKDSKECLTESKGSSRSVIGACGQNLNIASQVEVGNRKDQSDTKSNGSASDVIKIKANDQASEDLTVMLSEPIYRDQEKTKIPATHDADKEEFKNLYEPKLVSVGPYHSQRKELQEVKSALKNYFDCFIQKSPDKLKEIIKGAKLKARSFYAGELPKAFTRSMFFDAYFLVSFLLQWNNTECESSFKERYNEVKDDLVLLDNQIPFFILKMVHGWVAKTYSAETPIPKLNHLILGCLLGQNYPSISNEESNGVSYLLELFYKVYTENWKTTKARDNGVGDAERKPTRFPCATELKESGVKFYVKKGTNNLLDISFEGGKLKVPFLIVNKRFLTILANLVLYEKHTGKDQKPVTSLVFFLRCLINTEADMSILHKAGIMENELCNDKELPAILRQICQPAMLNYQSHQLSGIFYNIDQFYKKKTNMWCYAVYKEYYYNPVSVIKSSLGAVAFTAFILNSTLNAYHAFHKNSHHCH